MHKFFISYIFLKRSSFLVQSCDINNIEEGHSNNATTEVTSQSPLSGLIAVTNFDTTHPI